MCLGGRVRCCGKGNQKKEEFIPLIAASADVDVIDYCAKVTIKQRYENKSANPIEAVYEFPLDERAAVCEFWAEIKDSKIVGTIKEKQIARNTYDDAIASGYGAYLLEETEKGLFTVNIGNFPPNEEVLIVIVYVIELGFEEENLKLVLPTTPFAPDGVKTNFERPSNSKNGKFAEIGNGLSISVNFDMSSSFRSISSPSHPIQFEFSNSNKKAKVTLANSNPLVKDFIILAKLSEPHKTCARIQQDSQNKVAMFAICPDLKDLEPVNNEILFLVDRSGSMSESSGKNSKSKIEEVKTALQIFLRSLPIGSLFNIISFGSYHHLLFKHGSQKYSDSTLQTASEYVDKMQADMGGTSLYEPLASILKENHKEGFPRQLFILTDGEVNSPDNCIDLVKKETHTTRVFTFGVGESASVNLVKGIAKAGEGKWEMISSDQDIEEVVMKQLNAALQPAITDLKMNWEDLGIKEYSPYYMSPIFRGSKLITYAYLPDKLDKEITVKLTGKYGTQKFVYESKFNVEDSLKGDPIMKLAAKAMIRDLEENRSFMHDPKGNLKVQREQITNQIVKLSLSYGIVSKFTSFVAVEKRKDAVVGEMELHKFSNDDLTKKRKREKVGLIAARRVGGSRGGRGGGDPGSRGGRGGSRGGRGGPVFMSAPRGVMRSERNEMPEIDLELKSKPKKKARHTVFEKEEDEDEEVMDYEMKTESKVNVNKKEGESELIKIIKAQKASGNFTEAVLSHLSINISKEMIEDEIGSFDISQKAILLELIIASIVCEVLEKFYFSSKTKWHLVFMKARSWIARESNKISEDWKSIVKKLMQGK